MPQSLGRFFCPTRPCRKRRSLRYQSLRLEVDRLRASNAIILKLAPASGRPQSSFPDRRRTLDATRFPFIQPPRCATTHRSSTPAAIYGTPYGRGVRNTSRRKSDAQRTSLQSNTGSMRSVAIATTERRVGARLARRRRHRQADTPGPENTSPTSCAGTGLSSRPTNRPARARHVTAHRAGPLLPPTPSAAAGRLDHVTMHSHGVDTVSAGI